MSNEQKELLLQIAELIVKDFDLEMKDHWTGDDELTSTRIFQKKRELKKQYNEHYGELPYWNSIDEVCDTVKRLRKEIE